MKPQKKNPTSFTKTLTLTGPILRKNFYSCAFKSMVQCCEPLARPVVPNVTVTRQKGVRHDDYHLTVSPSG